MLRIVLILSVVFALLVACHVEVTPADQQVSAGEPIQADNVWRRTVDGWERVNVWGTTNPGPGPGLSPLVVGIFEGLLSVTALVAFPGRPALARVRA